MGMQPLDLSFNSTTHLVVELVVLHATFPCSVSFWCILGVSVELWTKDILRRFMKGQTWHAKMLWKPCSNLHIDSNHALKPYPTWEVLDAKQPTPTQKSQRIFYFSMLYFDAMESMMTFMRVCEVGYVGVIWFILHVLQLLLNRFTQPNLCNYVSYLQWSINKIGPLLI